MMIRLFTVLLIFSSFTSVVSKDELIPWNKDRKLVWNDFKARPDNNSENAALTSSAISFEWGFNENGFSYTMTCTFDKQKSWGRIKNDYILAHEQGHFDITEIYARKLKKALKEYKFDEKKAPKELSNMYSKLMSELSQTQNVYDHETDHSRKTAQQQEWLLKISKDLDDLKAYADY